MNLLRLNVVLAAIDFDEASKVALAAARALADAAGAQLQVVHVTPADARGVATEAPPHEVDSSVDSSTDAVVEMLDRASVPLERVQIHVLAGDPARMIRALADRVRADVIVLGAHREDSGHRAAGRQLGGTALAIATASWAPCLIVRQGIRLPLKTVLAPVDLSDTARGALMVALSWSSALRGGGATGTPPETERTRLTALYVDRAGQQGRPSDGSAHGFDAELDRVRREAGTWADVAIDGVMVEGPDVASAIVDGARDNSADLIVLGTRGLGIDPLGRIGSVSAAVLRQADVPVLLVPPAVWATYSKSDRQ